MFTTQELWMLKKAIEVVIAVNTNSERPHFEFRSQIELERLSKKIEKFIEGNVRHGVE